MTETEAFLPDPPYDPDVNLSTFDHIDMPMDWLAEDWALGLSAAGLGVLFRLYAVSLRQATAGSLPADRLRIQTLLQGDAPGAALDEALELWPLHSDGRRYWPRIQSVIDAAWARRRGKKTKEAMRKRRERCKAQLIKVGLTEQGASNRDVLDLVLAEIPEGERLTFQNVYAAAERAGAIGGAVRPIRPEVSGTEMDSPEVSEGQSRDSWRTVGGQMRDSHGTVTGQLADSLEVSDPPRPTRYGCVDI